MTSAPATEPEIPDNRFAVFGRTFCAVSRSATLHCDEMPRAIANRVVKSEFIAENVVSSFGDDLMPVHALYVIITAGPERFESALLDAAGKALERTAGHDRRQAGEGGIESFGLCVDPALGDRLRVSVWAFAPPQA